MHTSFEIKSIGDWSYLYYPLLESQGIFHGFGTRPRQPSGEEAGIEDAVSAFSLEPHIVMNQEHGDTVHLIKAGGRPNTGDGLLLLERNVAGIIKTADCLPVILYDTSTPAVAIVHAGWRGTALGIASKAARHMLALGCEPESMGALIGPGIGPCCYNVQEDVAGVFSALGFAEPVLQSREGSLYLDLKAANIRMLQAEGVKTFHDVDLCTHCRKDLFYSARRDKGHGRQINFVVIRGIM